MNSGGYLFAKVDVPPLPSHCMPSTFSAQPAKSSTVGGLGALSSRSGFERSPTAKRFMVHLELKIVLFVT